VATLDEEIDRLFALPLDEFTPVRNALAQRLKKEGDEDGADTVRALEKPSVPVWVINQLARSDPEAVRELLNAGAGLRDAQERALRGDAGAEGLVSAQAAERNAVRALTKRAGELLADAGRPASRATLDRVDATLRAAAVEPDARASLQAGRLRAELTPAGFESLAGLGPAPGSPSVASPANELAERRREKAELEQRKAELKERVRELERRARAAERDADRAESAARDARRLADATRQEADDASAELDDL
jgi:hypothetical protein